MPRSGFWYIFFLIYQNTWTLLIILVWEYLQNVAYNMLRKKGFCIYISISVFILNVLSSSRSLLHLFVEEKCVNSCIQVLIQHIFSSLIYWIYYKKKKKKKTTKFSFQRFSFLFRHNSKIIQEKYEKLAQQFIIFLNFIFNKGKFSEYFISNQQIMKNNVCACMSMCTINWEIVEFNKSYLMIVNSVISKQNSNNNNISYKILNCNFHHS